MGKRKFLFFILILFTHFGINFWFLRYKIFNFGEVNNLARYSFSHSCKISCNFFISSDPSFAFLQFFIFLFGLIDLTQVFRNTSGKPFLIYYCWDFFICILWKKTEPQVWIFFRIFKNFLIIFWLNFFLVGHFETPTNIFLDHVFVQFSIKLGLNRSSGNVGL